MEKCLLLSKKQFGEGKPETLACRAFFCLKAKIKAILPFNLDIPNTQLIFQRVHPTVKVSGVLKHS